MSDVIAAKFGGSSVSDGPQTEKVINIIKADPRRRIVIPSAPGKRNGNDTKITDELINIATYGVHLKKPVETSLEFVVDRFCSIQHHFGVDAGKIETFRNKFVNYLSKKDFRNDAERFAYFAAGGEIFQPESLLNILEVYKIPATVITPKDASYILKGQPDKAKFDDAYLPVMGNFLLKKLNSFEGILLFTAYCGITEDGTTGVQSRGGADTSGGNVSASVNALVYENWTDVDGVCAADPKVIENPKVITEMQTEEMRQLSINGFSVLHEDAMLNCEERRVPINIKNTNNPSAPGTMIVSERVPREDVIGIGSLKEIAAVQVKKKNPETGFSGKILDIFANHGISTDYYPATRDTLTVIVKESDLRGKANQINRDIYAAVNPKEIKFTYSLSGIVPVGLGLLGNDRAFLKGMIALENKGIKARIKSQDLDDIGYFVAVDRNQYSLAVQTLYDAYFKE